MAGILAAAMLSVTVGLPQAAGNDQPPVTTAPAPIGYTTTGPLVLYSVPPDAYTHRYPKFQSTTQAMSPFQPRNRGIARRLVGGFGGLRLHH